MFKIVAIIFIISFFFQISLSQETRSEQRQILILPSGVSPPDFKSHLITVSDDYIQKYLVGKKDFTFMDVTDLPLSNITDAVKIQEPEFPIPRRHDIVKPILEKINTESCRSFLTGLSSHQHRQSRRAGGELAGLWIKAEVEKVLQGLPQSRKNRFKIEMVPITGFLASSIILKFEGTGNDNDEHVIVGAHYDDVGHTQAGADDDGSGSTAVFESFRVIAQSNFSPSKTLTWMWYSAEESGLVGSTQIANDWKRRQVKVRAHLNYDMVGNPSRGLLGRRLTLNTTPKFTEWVNDNAKAHTKLELDQWRFNGGSDHIPWTRNGYPSACLSERVFSPYYHGPNDIMQNVSFELITEFARLAAAVLIEAA